MWLIIIFPILQFFVGIYQVLSTLVLYTRYSQLSKKYQSQLNAYSIVASVYLISLYWLDEGTLNLEDMGIFYLFVLPWGFAIWRMIFGREAWRDSRTQKTASDREDLLDVRKD